MSSNQPASVVTSPIAPPAAAREPRNTPLHGTVLHDDYGWLRDKGSPRVTEYLEAENAWTAAQMADTGGTQEELYREILSHIKEDDVSVPYRDGDWEYLTRTETGLQYPRFCRRAAARHQEPVPEETILDVNRLAEGQPFMSLGALALSPEGNLLAYTTDNTGFRQYTLAIRDLRSGEVLADTAERVGSVVWAADSRTLFYSTEDEQTKRQDRVWRHQLGSTLSEDLEVFHEPDERFNLGVGRTRDRQYLLLEAGSHTTSETWVLNADRPREPFELFAPRIDEEEYDIDHRDGFWYVHTNHKAEQFRLMQTAHGLGGREFWVELLPEHPEAPLQNIDLFRHFLVATYRERGLPVLRVFALGSEGKLTSPHDIRFPDPAYSASGEINRDFNASTYRYAYQSLVRPPSVFEYDVLTGRSTLLKEAEVPGGFSSSNYRSERLWFKASDGTEVPVSLVYRPDCFQKNAGSPLYVYGYGSYGYPLPLGFSRFPACLARSRHGDRLRPYTRRRRARRSMA